MLPENDIETLVNHFAALRDMVDSQRVSGAADWPHELVNNLSTIAGALQELTSSTLNLFHAGITPSEQLSMLSYIQEIREDFNAGLFGTWRDVVNSSRLPEPPILLDVFVETLANRMKQLGDVLEKCRDAMYVAKPDAVSDEQYSTKKSMYDTFAWSMLNANLIHNRLKSYKNGIDATPTESLPEGANTTVETVAGPVFGVYVNRTEDDIVILERIPDKQLVQVYMDDREHRDLYDVNREYAGKVVTVSSGGGVVPFHQPEVDIALQRALEDSQSIIQQQMNGKTPVGKGGLTVLVCANTGKGADNRWKEIWERNIRTVTYPEGSVLVGHPESPFCARMYMHKLDQKVVLLADVGDRNRILIKENGDTVMPVGFSIEDCELMTPEQSRSEWERFGYQPSVDSHPNLQNKDGVHKKNTPR